MVTAPAWFHRQQVVDKHSHHCCYFDCMQYKRKIRNIGLKHIHLAIKPVKETIFIVSVDISLTISVI